MGLRYHGVCRRFNSGSYKSYGGIPTDSYSHITGMTHADDLTVL